MLASLSNTLRFPSSLGDYEASIVENSPSLLRFPARYTRVLRDQLLYCLMTKMSKINGDFIQLLGIDISLKILTYLDDPVDIVCVSSVSKLWHQFVIENGIARQLCFKKFPEISRAASKIEASNMIEPLRFDAGDSSAREWRVSLQFLKRNHRLYSILALGLSPSIRNDVISAAISASSTDNYPIESIAHTLEARDRFESGASSYWSSGGQIDPSVPETLLYKLSAKLCLVTEIHVQPFQAYFQFGFPLYSCKAVRFRMGHVSNLVLLQSALEENDHIAHDDRFVWTYISPEFPMTQENILQKFELPEPALCIGGFLLVELLGRNQRQDIDGLYYICISHVQVMGRPLSPAFDVELVDPSGKCSLKYFPKSKTSPGWSPRASTGEAGESSQLRTIFSRFMRNRLRAAVQAVAGEHQLED